MESDFAVGGSGGRGEGPEPGEEFGPRSLGEFEAGKGGDEARGGGASLAPARGERESG